MSERRILFGRPEGVASTVQLTRSRMDETPATEFDIPHYQLWDDGSEYEVFDDGETVVRRYHGPLFGLPMGAWKTEREYWGAA